MIRSWRFWVLFVLFVGPIVAYMGLGALWLHEHHWGFIAFSIWVVLGILFGILAVQWTRKSQAVLPPIDWNVPRTFSPFDKLAWALVEEEANRDESLSMDALCLIDTYVDTGKRLTSRLAAHYHPLATNPVEHIPVVQILTALELAAEDLEHLCREVPGGDMVTPAHWKKAVAAAGFFSKANEIYGYLLPIFQPATGLVRLGTQKLMVQPKWRNMQQNVLRWFFRAYVNRFGTHLIELYSGRLAIGTEGYRRLTRKAGRASAASVETPPPLVIGVAGASDESKTALFSALKSSTDNDLTNVRGHLASAGFDESLADLLKTAQWVDIPSYSAIPPESSRSRSLLKQAVAEASQSDLVVLAIDADRDDLSADAKFVEALDDHFSRIAALEAPPVLAVLLNPNRDSSRDGNGSLSSAERERLLRTKLDWVRQTLPSSIAGAVVVSLNDQSASISGHLLPVLAPLLDRAERISLLRHLHAESSRSKARRLIGQIGQRGRKLWNSLRSGKKA